MSDTTKSLRAVLESCLDKSDPSDVWCEICKRWEGANEQHADWCPVPAFALALARLEAAEQWMTRYEGLLRECLSVFGHPNFTDRYDMAPRLRAALGRERKISCKK